MNVKLGSSKIFACRLSSVLDMAFVLRTFLLSVFTAVIYCEEEFFNITRRYTTDQFIIPSSICKWTPLQQECSTFHIRSTIVARRCECRCPHEASTFGFVSGKWICLENTEFRTKAGCTYKFGTEYDDNYPLEVLETGRRQQKNIQGLPSDSCKIDFSSSRYLKCDGSWSGLGLSDDSDVFQLQLSGNDNGISLGYKFKITKKASLAGRIVKLQLNCATSSKSSCILFKIAGKIACPVDPTKKSNASGGQSGASSGTAAAVVIIIILVIVVAAIIVFIIWKRKRGENVWVMDRISSIATKVRDRSSPKVKEEQQQEQIYAEIPDQPVQTTHSQNTPEETATQIHAGTRTAILLSGGSVVLEDPTDDDGYAVPPDSPDYNELEDPNLRNTGDNGWAGKLDSNKQQDGSREVAGSDITSPGATVSGLSGAADNKYVTKQRRKPPCPPQKGKDMKEKGLNVNDGTDVKEKDKEGNDTNHDYESLKDDNRDVYQPLDRNTMNNR